MFESTVEFDHNLVKKATRASGSFNWRKMLALWRRSPEKGIETAPGK
jgi:hypothetical protein